MDQSVHQFTVRNIDGEEVSLKDYEGKVVMIVNTASKCGFTPQLKDMEELYAEFRKDQFEILAFPSNDFAGQEPLEGEAIKQFCQINYNAEYPIFDKVHVKGSQAHELFKFLGSKRENGTANASPKWNFYKYLIGPDGKLVQFYSSITKPTASKVKRNIRKLLEKTVQEADH